jgi:DHA2 family multidrug resistance protein
MSAKKASPASPLDQKFTRLQWMILLTLIIGTFLGRLDGTIVNLALPKMITDFGITVSQASWISTAYIIANAIFVPVFGKLGDLMGRKPLYIFGIVGFTISSMLAGLAWSLPSMLFFRILQAITVSIDYPIALSIIAFEFLNPKLRAQAMGIWSGVFALAVVFGPLLGGPLTDLFGWRAVFYINVPLGILGIFMAVHFLVEPVSKIKGIKHFDWLGSLVLGISLGTMVLVLDQGQSWGWTSTKSILSYLIAVGSLLTFIWIEKREKEPVIDLKFFSNPAFTSANIVSFISFMGLAGGIFLLPVFVQTILGYSVTLSGFLFIPMAFGIMIGAQTGARLLYRVPIRIFVSIGMFWAAFVLFNFSGIDVKWSFFDMAWRLMAFAVGIGIGFAALTQSATGSVPIQEVGVASSVLALSRNLAGAFGIAIFATILSNSVTSQLMAIESHSLIHTHDPVMLKAIPALMAVKANINAYGTVFRWASLFVFFGGIAALFLRDPKPQTAGAQHHPVEIG